MLIIAIAVTMIQVIALGRSGSAVALPQTGDGSRYSRANARLGIELLTSLRDYAGPLWQHDYALQCYASQCWPCSGMGLDSALTMASGIWLSGTAVVYVRSRSLELPSAWLRWHHISTLGLA